MPAVPVHEMTLPQLIDEYRELTAEYDEASARREHLGPYEARKARVAEAIADACIAPPAQPRRSPNIDHLLYARLLEATQNKDTADLLWATAKRIGPEHRAWTGEEAGS